MPFQKRSDVFTPCAIKQIVHVSVQIALGDGVAGQLRHAVAGQFGDDEVRTSLAGNFPRELGARHREARQDLFCGISSASAVC